MVPEELIKQFRATGVGVRRRRGCRYGPFVVMEKQAQW